MVIIANIKTNGIRNLFYSILFYLHLPYSQRGENLGFVTKMVNDYHWKYKDKWNNEYMLFYSVCIYHIVKEGKIWDW